MKFVRIFVITFLLFYNVYSQEARKAVEGVCQERGCKAAGEMLKASINESVDPCEDFFEFACGRWIESNPIPDDAPAVDVFTIVTDRVEQKLRDLLEEEDREEPSSAIRKSRNLYQSCINMERRNKEESRPLWKALESFGKWPILDVATWGPVKKKTPLTKNGLTDMLAAMDKEFSLNPLFSLAVDTDIQNSTKYVLHLYESELAGGPRDYFLKAENENIREKYKTLMKTVIWLVGADAMIPLDESYLDAEVEKIFEFERKFAEIHLSEEEWLNVSRLENKWTSAQVKDRFFMINWNSYLDQVLPPEVRQAVDADTEIVVPDPDYLFRLNQLVVLDTDYSVVKNYIFWNFASQWMNKLDDRYVKIRAEYQRKLFQQKNTTELWKKCLRITKGELERAVGALYVEGAWAPSTATTTPLPALSGRRKQSPCENPSCH